MDGGSWHPGSDVLRQLSVQHNGSAVLVTQTAAASGPSTITVPENGDVLQTSDGHAVTLPAGVPATAGVFLLPLP